MFFGSWTSRRVTDGSRASSRFTLCLLSAGLLSGCGDVSSPLADSYAVVDYTDVTWTRTPADAAPTTVHSVVHRDTLRQPHEPQVAAMMPTVDYLPRTNQPTTEVLPSEEVAAGPQEVNNPYWSFDKENVTNDEAGVDDTWLNPPALIRLPAVDDMPAVENDIEPQPADDEFSGAEPPLALLLPPQQVVIENQEFDQPDFADQSLTLSPSELTEIESPAFDSVEASTQPLLAELTEQEQLLARLLRDSSSATTGVLTDHRVNELAKKKIQQAYAMASRGSLYVARQELIEVLRMISRAKDAQQGKPERAVALAAGLRALREAEDFAPRGTQLEAELDIGVLCASHRTPVAKQADSMNLLPGTMMDRYLRYAQLQLAMSVTGEPAGSMALHALGKLNSQLGRIEPTKHRIADRHAIAFQQASLLAHNQNHLAAHELAVLLATSGHFVEAEQLLQQVAAREPNAVVYRNLARVREKLGQPELALANRDIARQLSRQGVTGTNNIQWVSPHQFAQGSMPTPRYSTAQRPMAQRQITQRQTTQQAPAQRSPTDQLVVPGSRRPAPQTLRRSQ